jgi:hypothetical protein
MAEKPGTKTGNASTGPTSSTNADTRRAALRKYAIDIANDRNRCQRLIDVVAKSAELAEGTTQPAQTMLDDLEQVLIGRSLTNRGSGVYFAGVRLGASGFKTNLQDRSDQTAHAVAGIVIGFRHGWLVRGLVKLQEPEAQDDRLYDATFPLGRGLNNANFRELAERLRTAVGGPECQAPKSAPSSKTGAGTK